MMRSMRASALVNAGGKMAGSLHHFARWSSGSGVRNFFAHPAKTLVWNAGATDGVNARLKD
jgi:hypothetical protein